MTGGPCSGDHHWLLSIIYVVAPKTFVERFVWPVPRTD